MKKPTTYIETSVVSYLTSPPSRDIVLAGRQQVTLTWWKEKRRNFDLFVSEFVISEARQGDAAAAAARMEALKGIPEISLTEEATRLAEEMVAKGPLPEKATLDAFHIAIAVSAGVDYLLTWNFKHLANAAMRRGIDRFCLSRGFEPCIICTPEELLEE